MVLIVAVGVQNLGHAGQVIVFKRRASCCCAQLGQKLTGNICRAKQRIERNLVGLTLGGDGRACTEHFRLFGQGVLGGLLHVGLKRFVLLFKDLRATLCQTDHTACQCADRRAHAGRDRRTDGSARSRTAQCRGKQRAAGRAISRGHKGIGNIGHGIAHHLHGPGFGQPVEALLEGLPAAGLCRVLVLLLLLVQAVTVFLPAGQVLNVALGALRLTGYRAQIIAQLVVLHLRRLHARLGLSQGGIQFGEPLGSGVSLLRRRGVIHGVLGTLRLFCKVLVLALGGLECAAGVRYVNLQADSVGVELVKCLLQTVHVACKRFDRLLHAVDGGREIVLRRHHNANVRHPSSPLSVLDLLQGHRPQDDALAPRDGLECGRQHMMMLEKVVHQVCVAVRGQFFCTSSTSSTVLRW